MTPVWASSLMPDGSDPAASTQIASPTPPARVSARRYDLPTRARPTANVLI